MEPNTGSGDAIRQTQQASDLDRRLDTSTSTNPESEQMKAREKMGALINKLDTGVKERGVIARVVGDKDDTGDHRAAILSEPFLVGEDQRNRQLGYIALTPDGAMIINTSDSMSNGRAVGDFMMYDLGPDDYPQEREYLKGLNYKAIPVGSHMTYRLEGQYLGRPMTVYMQPAERSQIGKDVNIEAQFDKSVARAAKPLEGSKNQATNASTLADTLGAKL